MRLIDIMNHPFMLTEARADWVIANMGKKLETQLQNEDSRIKSRYKISDVTSLVTYLTAGGPYDRFVQWLSNQYIKGHLKLEDVKRVHDDLDLFEKFKSKIAIKDINQIKTPEELYDLTKDFKGVKTGGEEKKELDKKMFKQATVVIDNDRLRILVPKTKAASCYFGVNTRWCTAAEKNNMFSHYNKQGALYIILFKKENKRYQFHLESGQLMDEEDRSVAIEDFNSKYPGILTGIGDYAFPTEQSRVEYLQKQNQSSGLARMALAIFKDPSEDLKKEIVLKSPSAIEFIANPSELLQITAVSQSPFAIQYIDNPTESVQLRAVMQRPDMIENLERNIKNVPESVQRAALERDGRLIKYIKKQTPELIDLAIETTPTAIVGLDRVTNDLIKKAVSNAINMHEDRRSYALSDSLNLIVVKFPDMAEDIKQMIVTAVPKMLTKFKDPSDKLKMAAIERDPDMIVFMNEPSREMVQLALKKKPELIKDLKNVPSDLARNTVIKDPEVIKYTKDPDLDLQMAAAKKNPRLISSVKDVHPDVQRYLASVGPQAAMQINPGVRLPEIKELIKKYNDAQMGKK